MESHLSGESSDAVARQGDQAPGRQPLALLNSAMTGAVSPRGGARSRLRAAVRLASFWQFCSRCEKLVGISTYACGCRYFAKQSFRIARCLRNTAIRSYLSILESVGSDLRQARAKSLSSTDAPPPREPCSEWRPSSALVSGACWDEVVSRSCTRTARALKMISSASAIVRDSKQSSGLPCSCAIRLARIIHDGVDFGR